MRVKVQAVAPAGYRCGGRLWPAVATEADVDAALLAKLKASPALVVVEMGGSAAPAAPSATAPTTHAATSPASALFDDDDKHGRKGR